MVITLDNGQTVTIYEQGNILKQIEPYIDKEIFDLLEEKFGEIDDLEFENEVLEDKLADKDEAYDSLEIDLDNLKDRYDDLYKENRELENQNNKILSQIKDIVNQSRNNKLAFHEVENLLEEIWEEN